MNTDSFNGTDSISQERAQGRGKYSSETKEQMKARQRCRKIIRCVLRTRRISLGITQEDAAENFAVSLQTWKRYENGVNEIPADLLMVIFQQWHIEYAELSKCNAECHKCSDYEKYSRQRCKRSNNVIQKPVYGPKSDRG